MLNRKWVAASGAIALITLLASCNGSATGNIAMTMSPQPTSSASPAGPAVMAATVSIHGYSFSPANVTIKAGGTVMWSNQDAVTHTATSDTSGQFDTGNIAAGAQSAAIPMPNAGTFAYHCAIHPDMHGTITVVP